jgi:Flp pilus assembly protein TadD
MHLGEWQAAELPIRRAIALWPQEPGQHLRLGRILAHEGKSTEAQRELLQELQIDPTSTAARGELQQLNDRQ